MPLLLFLPHSSYSIGREMPLDRAETANIIATLPPVYGLQYEQTNFLFYPRRRICQIITMPKIRRFSIICAHASTMEGFYCVAWQDRSPLTQADPWFAPDHEPIYNGFRNKAPMLTSEELAFLRTGMLDF